MGSNCKRLLLAFIFLTEANFLALPQPFFTCIDNENYTHTGDNSTYRANLNAVLSTLITNLDSNGFSNASVGQSPDRANAIIFCRGDVLPDVCRSCAQNARIQVVELCPIAKQATIWNWEERCTLRYSNETILGKMMNVSYWYNYYIKNATIPELDLTTLMDGLRDKAANGGPLRKVAAGKTTMTVPDFNPIYSLVQCSPDLSSSDCDICLTGAISESINASHCKGKMGCRVLKPSCSAGFVMDNPYYNETRLQELEAPVPAGPGPVPAPQIMSSPPPPSGKPNGNKSRTVIIIIVSIVASSILAVLVVILLRKKIKRNPMEKLDGEGVDGISTVESLQYTFSTIKLATNDFSDDNKLGQGGFGAVYKGILSNGREIAVKRLSKNSVQGILEFKNEVLLLAKLQHRNLVRLLGFCLEGTEKLLVYEFVQNASLDFFIFDRINHSYLNWEIRYKIIKGIARGILYLHEDSRLRIIHRDLKASNVLLDGDMNPKIADFGMARLFGQDETQGNTNRIVGTYGYMAPEYALHGRFSIKSDVFSFGMLVLEIISGQRNYFRCGKNAENLLNFAWKNWREGTPTYMVDPFLRSGLDSMSYILRCIHIGLLCVQENAADRPTMDSVVLMLSSSSLTLAVPSSEPEFYMASGNDSEDVLMQEYISRDLENNNSSKSNKAVHSGDSSNNDASITEL